MVQSIGYAALSAGGRLAPFRFQRRDSGPNDVVIAILYCGICHTDLHYVDNDWGTTAYPLVPGHEIIGRVVSVGAAVRKFQPGDTAGIGCIVDSCRVCGPCRAGDEHWCEEGLTGSMGGRERGTGNLTYGGYSNNYVVDERFVVRIPPTLDPAAAAPLLCAGITTYSALRHWTVGAGQRVGVVGVGGLGHLAIKLARAMDAEVVVFTTSSGKAKDAIALGAHEVVVSTEAAHMQRQSGRLDFILDTAAVQHDVNAYLATLKNDGVLCLVGMPAGLLGVSPWALGPGRKRLAASLIGGMRETQETVDFCGRHGISANTELIPIQRINEAYERLKRNDVKYRFVIDPSSLQG